MDDELKKNIRKTGTSILGIKCTDGIVIAADRQVTAGNIVMAKNEQKAFKVNEYIVAAGCGVAADIKRVPKLLAAELKIKGLRDKKKPTIQEAANLLAHMSYSGIRQPSMIPQQAGFLMAEFNEDGSTGLYSIEPAGGVYKVEDYDANFGSGMPYILGILEKEYKEEINVEEGVRLAIDAIKASSQRDSGSGYGIDIFTITKEGIKHAVKQKAESVYTDQ